eukprot:3871891-Rhodomonas_salina.4
MAHLSFVSNCMSLSTQSPSVYASGMHCPYHRRSAERPRAWQVQTPTSTSYAVYSTNAPYGAPPNLSCGTILCPVLTWRMPLCSSWHYRSAGCYAMADTDSASCYAVFGTDIVYGVQYQQSLWTQYWRSMGAVLLQSLTGISLRARYAMAGTDMVLAYARQCLLSAYAHAMQCPVLIWRMVLRSLQIWWSVLRHPRVPSPYAPTSALYHVRLCSYAVAVQYLVLTYRSSCVCAVPYLVLAYPPTPCPVLNRATLVPGVELQYGLGGGYGSYLCHVTASWSRYWTLFLGVRV